jgi:outer membrane protein OmpA-like peptidoglycan-associated protein
MRRILAIALIVGLAGCAGSGSRTEGPGERALARAEKVPVPAVAADGELTLAEVPTYLAAQQKALRKALQPAADSGLLRVGIGRDGATRVVLSTLASFDPQSAQLSPQALLPLTAIADILQRDRASVLHVVAVDATDTALAERRAVAAAAVLINDGASPGRVRAEARRGSGESRVEFVFAPLLAGHGAQAWMPPADQ